MAENPLNGNVNFEQRRLKCRVNANWRSTFGGKISFVRNKRNVVVCVLSFGFRFVFLGGTTAMNCCFSRWKHVGFFCPVLLSKRFVVPMRNITQRILFIRQRGFSPPKRPISNRRKYGYHHHSKNVDTPRTNDKSVCCGDHDES